jgi:predicted molibdopterin-dependent oxidoreductase YjgC
LEFRTFGASRALATFGSEAENPDIVVLMDDGLVRLTEPLVRENGRLRPASWEEALERAAAGFATARDKGPNAFGMFSCSKQSNEMNYIAQKFTRAAMHSNNIDSCNRT